MSERVVVIVGAGPGVSGSLARLLAREGYAVGLVGVDTEVLEGLSAEIRGAGAEAEWAVADVTDAAAATQAIVGLVERWGRVDLLHFNPSAFRAKDPMELTADELLADMALGVGALLTSVQAARRFMERGARVTVTGSMAADQPSTGAASLGVQKAGVRNLVQSLDAALRTDGIRAVTVTVRGSLSSTGPFTPGRVAEALIAASRQREDDWQVEVPYDGPISA